MNDPRRFHELKGETCGISHRRILLLESNAHDDPIPSTPRPYLSAAPPREVVHLIPPAPSPRCNSAVRLSMSRVERREVREILKFAPLLSSSTVVLSEKGIAICSLVKFVTDTEAVVGRPGWVTADARGLYRYSARINRPSGGTKERACDSVHRFNLPYASVKRTVRHHTAICERQLAIGGA